MPKDEIIELLKEAATEAQRKNLLPPVALPDITLEHPQNPEHGDYASSLPLKLARAARMNPLAIAKTLSSLLPVTPQVDRIEVASPGFINFHLKSDWLIQEVEAILKAGEAYGDSHLGRGNKVQVEFVSVNPTGPIHVGHGRGAILGSALSNILAAAGYSVEREYWVNDVGNQMESFYRSLYARYRQVLGLPADMPTDGYHGEYMVELAREIMSEEGERFLRMSEDRAVEELGATGLKKIVASIKSDLQMAGVELDVWFSCQSLYDRGDFQKALTLLREKGFVAEKEGAVWFTSTALGEDKDNVIVRSSGPPTYFGWDIAYHYNKFLEREFDRVINIWGADHLGHVSRVKAMVNALGVSPERLQIIITQMVTLKRGDEVVRVSKRTGDLVTLREVLEEVGADACRFFFLSRSADSQMEFDLELAKKQSEENPVYYVQYAHARIASILRLAQERNINYSNGDVSLITSEPELTLIRKMIVLPELVELAARNLEPHYLPHYAQELATVFHSFYKQCRVVSQDEALTRARLKLVEAAQIVLAKTLRLMGINAPERM